jgi:anti-sigma-K factor RskA
MTTPDNKKGGRSRDEVLAGEYVLGVLPISERQNVERRIRDDRTFALIVDRWQTNLSTFNDDYPDTSPPPAWIYASIERQLFADGTAPDSAFERLWNSVAFWRGMALVACSAALLLASNANGIFQSKPSMPALVATLNGSNATISLATYYNANTGSLKFSPSAVDQKTQSLELWLIEGSSAPVPLGILPDNANGEIIIPKNLRNQLKDGVTLAVSLEPYGGSPTGKPTGPVIASGMAGSI